MDHKDSAVDVVSRFKSLDSRVREASGIIIILDLLLCMLLLMKQTRRVGLLN